MATKTRLTIRQRDELRAYLHDGLTAFAGLRAQNCDPKGSPSVPEHDGISDRQLASGRAHHRVQGARQALEGGSGGGEHWGVLRLSYGPLAPDDRHESRYDMELSALLRMTDQVQSEAARRWTVAERARLLACAASEDRPRLERNLFPLPASPGAIRALCTRVIAEGRREILDGDEVMLGAIAQARGMLAAAELAYLVALRVVERDGQAAETAIVKRAQNEAQARLDGR